MKFDFLILFKIWNQNESDKYVCTYPLYGYRDSVVITVCLLIKTQSYYMGSQTFQSTMSDQSPVNPSVHLPNPPIPLRYHCDKYTTKGLLSRHCRSKHVLLKQRVHMEKDRPRNGKISQNHQGAGPEVSIRSNKEVHAILHGYYCKEAN